MVANEPPPMRGEATQPAARTRRMPFHLIELGALLGDLIVILGAAVVSGIGYQTLVLEATADADTFLAVGALVFANFFALTSAQQNYRPTNLINTGRQFRYVTMNWLFIFFVLTAVAFTLKIATNFSRGSTLSFFVLGLVCLLTFRWVLARYLKGALATGAFAEQRIILISERGQQSTSRALDELRQCGYRPVKIVEITSAEIDSTGVTTSLSQKIQSVISISQTDPVDYVFLLLKWNKPHLINNLVQMLRALPIPVHLLPDENVETFLSARSGNIGTTFTVELQRAPLSKSERALKRAFDVISAASILILLSPLMLLTALMIKIDSPGPALFRQKRNGFNGSVFSIYKFRSMRVLEDGAHIPQATRDDPRVTRLGRWLRRTSIDELPQLFNVLTGDMSLVGPRPHAVAHNNEYQTVVSNYAFRHHVKPGITGWAQVNGLRGKTQTVDLMAKRVEFDLWYINHWSLWLDLRIIIKTALMTARQPSAY
ncbi:MAG: undecaprenyl-phosphate glucose phosphotransferase [Pseudolabrys sp.]|nr:undecaprenyl-phosphate glucose phosphotransferase [Pseudolabrys sp.]